VNRCALAAGSPRGQRTFNPQNKEAAACKLPGTRGNRQPCHCRSPRSDAEQSASPGGACIGYHPIAGQVPVCRKRILRSASSWILVSAQTPAASSISPTLSNRIVNCAILPCCHECVVAIRYELFCRPSSGGLYEVPASLSVLRRVPQLDRI
jgi:hypothetical protein